MGIKYKSVKCSHPMCNKLATVLVIARPDTPTEAEYPMCMDCARERKKTAAMYSKEVLITTLD